MSELERSEPVNFPLLPEVSIGLDLTSLGVDKDGLQSNCSNWGGFSSSTSPQKQNIVLAGFFTILCDYKGLNC